MKPIHPKHSDHVGALDTAANVQQLYDAVNLLIAKYNDLREHHHECSQFGNSETTKPKVADNRKGFSITLGA